MKQAKIVVILGPTASGKTKLGVELARQFNGEIISADSRQVYKGMDVGTGKDLAEYDKGRNGVNYHLIDVALPKQQYDLKKYQKAAYEAILGLIKHDKLPIIVGGSGLYLQAVVDGYVLTDKKPEISKRSDLEKKSLKQIQMMIAKADKNFFERFNNSEKNNKRRLIRYLEIITASKSIIAEKPKIKKPPYDFLVIGLELGMETLRKRIKQRILDRLGPSLRWDDNMIEEVKKLHEAGLSYKRLESFGLEYKFIALYLQKKLSKAEMIEKLSIATGQFAKRQMTWFRRWEKQGREIEWFNAKENKKIVKTVKQFLSSK
ncbi:MAG: tRNA (adenosine(37)-N6)-dimethylallyltransferase MiaA [Candidatus Falkowbacteria bacterium]|nr:tRNA (adenosine(37)-N6)-dimethylallyltransferase MiaA [Candidatus Falkowbacteria bacterium]